MSSVSREYRVRIAKLRADVVDGNVAAVLGLDTLAGIPVVTGQIVQPTRGSTETMPFPVLALDRDNVLTTLFTENRRWVALGRLLDVQYRDLPAGDWVTYGTGRISALDEADGPGRFRIEVSDESWKARSSSIFTTANTTQVWPHGIKAHWRGWAGALPAAGAREAQRGSLYRIRLRAGRGNRGRYIAPELIEWASSDAGGYDERQFGSDAVEGNFRHLRLNYAGRDYKIISFGPVEAHGDILETLKSPEDKDPRSEYREVTIRAWVHAAAPPPASGPAYLHAPEAEPSEALPLHVGLADSGHDWGTESGWIHPAALTRIYWDLTGQLYDSAALAALEADRSLPALAFRILKTPEDPDRWFQDHVWGPCMLVALRDGQGRRKLVDMRMPQDLDPDTLPVIHAGNSDARTWRLVGREAVNRIVWSYLHTIQHGFGAGVGEGLGGRVGLDGIYAEEREDTPREGSTVATIGARPLSLSLIGALEPTASFERGLPYGLNTGGTRYQSAVEVMTRDLHDIYQDGAVLGSIELGRELAETLEEGSLAILDESSLQGVNPETGGRSGDRLVRTIALTRHPAHAEAEYLDLGPSAQPLPPPQVGVTPDPADWERVLVTLLGVPADALATVEVAFTDTADEPTAWPIGRAGRTDGALNIGGAPGDGYAHVRAKTTARGRIRSRWVSTSVALQPSARVRAVEVLVDDDGNPTVSWTPNAHAAGVRIRHSVHAPDDPDPELIHQIDVDASTGEVELPVQVMPDQVITVEVVPWSGWTGSAVSGEAGPAVQVSATHPDVPLSERPTASIELESETAAAETLRFTGALGARGRLPLSYQFAVEGVSAWSPWALMTNGVIVTDGLDGRPAPIARGERTRTVLLRVRDALGRESQAASYALSHEPTDVGTGPQPGLFARGAPHWSRPGQPSHLELRLEYGSPGTRAVYVEFQYREFGQPGGPVDQWSSHAYTLPAGIWRQSLWLEDRSGIVHTWDPLDTPPRITITPYSEPGDRQGTPGTPIIVDAALPGGSGGVRVRGGGPDDPIIQADYLGIGGGLALSRNASGYPVVALSGGSGVDWVDGYPTYDARYDRRTEPLPYTRLSGSVAGDLLYGEGGSGGWAILGRPGTGRHMLTIEGQVPRWEAVPGLGVTTLASVDGSVLLSGTGGPHYTGAVDLSVVWADGYPAYDGRYRRVSDTVPAADIAGKLVLANLPALATLRPAPGGGLTGSSYDGHTARDWGVDWDLGTPTYDQYYADKSHGHPALTPGSGLSGSAYDGLTARSWSVDWSAGRSHYDLHYLPLGYSPTWADVNKAGSSLADLATRSASSLNAGTLATTYGGTGAGQPGAAGRILRSSSSSAAAWVAPSLLTAGGGLTGSAYDGGTARTWSVNWAAGATALYDGAYAAKSHSHPLLTPGSGLSGTAYDGLTARQWSVDWTSGESHFDARYIPRSTGVTWADVDKTGSSLADLTTRAISATTGTLALNRGGTGLSTTPGATGRFLRSSSSSAAAWSGILAADLPTHTHPPSQISGGSQGQVLWSDGTGWQATAGNGTNHMLRRGPGGSITWEPIPASIDPGVTGLTIASGLGLKATGTGGPRYTGEVGLSVVWADGYPAYDGRYSRLGHTHPYLPLTGGTLAGPLTAGGGQGTILLHQNGYIDATRGGHLLRLNANYGNSNTHAHIGTDTALPLRFGTGAQANYAIHIDLNQNVGIGTTNPSSKLHVNGTITAQHATFTGTVTATRFRTS